LCRPTVKQAGIDPARLSPAKLVEHPDTVEGQIQLDLVEPDTLQRSRVWEFLRRIGGAVTGKEPADE
jgi:hypothetical protein